MSGCDQLGRGTDAIIMLNVKRHSTNGYTARRKQTTEIPWTRLAYTCVVSL